MNGYMTKREPEMFSEDLYPLQAGKQKLEAYLDRALKDNKMASVSQRQQHFKDDEIENLHTENTDLQQPGKDSFQPSDLIFSSPDIDLSRYEDTYSGVSTEDKGDSKERNIDKRWWAAESLNRFRLPKSSRWIPRRTHSARIDPALYFIGLGWTCWHARIMSVFEWTFMLKRIKILIVHHQDIALNKKVYYSFLLSLNMTYRNFICILFRSF